MSRLGLSALALAALVALVTPAGATAGGTNDDALQRRVRGELRSFTRWLDANAARGYVGEVGWPDNARGDADRWNELASKWYRDADAAGLWVTAWATGEWWGGGYKLSVYENREWGDGVEAVNPQAAVVERHLATRAYGRGVTVNGGEFGSPITARTSRFSNANPGAYNTRYHYDKQGTFDFLARRGIQHVRIPFRWERIQPRLGGPLDRREVGRLRDVVGRARQAGLDVMLDMHNYANYYLSNGTEGVRRPIGSSKVTLRHFANVWRRISSRFRSVDAVTSYAIMAEPMGMPGTRRTSAAELWERASQRALDAIRSTGDRKLVMVPGYGWSAVRGWARRHPDGWISDPARNFAYEAHHYWDRDWSGDYRFTYAEELARARAEGY